MEPTRTVARRSPGRWLILLGVLLSALTLSGIAVSPAMAEEVSTAASTEEPAATEEPAEEDFEFHFRGNVQYNSEPLEGVRIQLEGNGFEAETETDADGRWEIGVPEKATYEVTLDEDTLPERFLDDPLPGDPAAVLTAERLQQLVAEYHRQRGW